MKESSHTYACVWGERVSRLFESLYRHSSVVFPFSRMSRETKIRMARFRFGGISRLILINLGTKSFGRSVLYTSSVYISFKRDCVQDIDYILWTGDLPPHDVWNQTREENLKILRDTVAQMVEMFPGIPIFPALGNHESAPVNRYVRRSRAFHLGAATFTFPEGIVSGAGLIRSKYTRLHTLKTLEKQFLRRSSHGVKISPNNTREIRQ